MTYEVTVWWATTETLPQSQTFTLEVNPDDEKFVQGWYDDSTVVVQVVSVEDSEDVRDSVFIRMPNVRSFRVAVKEEDEVPA
jgi:hypothetical protein